MILNKQYLVQLKHILFAGLLFALFALFIHPAFAQYFSDSEHSIYQISLPLSPQNDYTIENQNHQISIAFSKVLAQELPDYTKQLPQLLHNQKLSADKRLLILDTKTQVATSAARKDNNLIITFRLQNSDTDKNAENPVELSFGQHDGFYRFVFKYQNAPLYSIKSENMQTTIYFLNKVKIIPKNLKEYPFYTEIMRAPNTMGGINIVFPSSLIKTSEYDNKIVLDIAKDKDLTNTALNLPDISTTALPAADNNENKVLPLLQNATHSENTGTKFSDNDIISLSFPWNDPTNISVFRREKYLWIVFDHRQHIDKEQILKTIKPLADEVLIIPHTKATVIRIKPRKELNVNLRKEGLLWIVDLSVSGLKENTKDMSFFTQYDSLKHPYFFVPSTTAGNIISVVDPSVGDNIITATTSEIGMGVSSGYNYADFDLLQSIQGIAIVPKNSDLNIERGNTGIIIKGNANGLHISDDLEVKKYQQSLLQQGTASEAFDLEIAPAIAGMSYIDALKQLYADIKKLPPEQKNVGQIELIKYLISKGLGTNALNALNQLASSPAYQPTEQTEALFGIANFLTRRYDEALENFSFGKLPEDNQAIFWRTLASAAKEYKKENNVILLSFISIIKDYPAALKARISLIGAQTAIRAGDDLAAQNFIDVLNSFESDNIYYRAQVEYLAAQRRVLQGYPRNAIKLFQHVGTSPSQKYSALARFDSAILEQKLGGLSIDKAINILEQLNFAWGEPNFRLNVLKTLANYYARKGDYLNALKKLQQTLPLENTAQKEKTIRQMVALFEDVFVNNQADNMSPLKSLAIYQDFEWLASQSDKYNQIIQHLADRLVAVDLLPRAYDLLQSQLIHGKLTPLEKSKVGTRLALISLFEDRNGEALRFLDSTVAPEMDDTLRAQRRIIRAKTLSNLHRDDEAIALLADDYSKNALLLKSEIYWNAGKWSEASDTLKYLVERPREGKPLSEEQIGYILDWTTALKKAGKNTVLVRLRNKFLPFFKDTKYYSTFSILTNNLENDKIDLKAISQTINEATAFSNFTKIYNDSLKNNSTTE